MQFLLGNDLQSCLDALSSERNDQLHLLERVTLDLQVQNSIVPTAYNLARFKISGHLPSLQVNLSDTKYKALMRLIDVGIPHFDEDGSDLAVPLRFKLPSGFFGASEEIEYNVDDAEDEADEGATSSHNEPEDKGEEFFDAADGVPTVSAFGNQSFMIKFANQLIEPCATSTRSGVRLYR